jgi:peroxiredoxin
MAPIAVGDSLPDGQLGWFDESDQLQQVSVHALAAGKKVILFGVPGAFTPTCRSVPVPPVSVSFPLRSYSVSSHHAASLCANGTWVSALCFLLGKG